MSEHIVSSFQRELESLSKEIAQMGTLAARQFEEALNSIANRDIELARRVIGSDAEIDALEARATEDAIQLMALRQPMAADLREAVAALKIAADFERVGDLAKSIAKRAGVLATENHPPPIHSLMGMAEVAGRQLTHVVEAFVSRDTEVARRVWRGDPEVDDRYTSLFRELLTYMAESPSSITACSHLLFVAKNVERVGDHCTNIAASVCYLVEGEPLKDARPKGEDPRLIGANR